MLIISNTWNARSDNSRSITKPGTISLTEKDDIYIRIENKSDITVYVSVISVDAAGKITLVSRAWE